MLVKWEKLKEYLAQNVKQTPQLRQLVDGVDNLFNPTRIERGEHEKFNIDEINFFKLASENATPEEWAEQLNAPVKRIHALANRLGVSFKGEGGTALKWDRKGKEEFIIHAGAKTAREWAKIFGVSTRAILSLAERESVNTKPERKSTVRRRWGEEDDELIKSGRYSSQDLADKTGRSRAAIEKRARDLRSPISRHFTGDNMEVSENKKAITFKEHVELVEAGEMTKALDKVSDWKEGSAFGGSAFGPTRDEKKKDDAGITGTTGTELVASGMKGLVPYYDEISGDRLPDEFAQYMPVVYSEDPMDRAIEQKRGKLYTHRPEDGENVWDVEDEITGEIVRATIGRNPEEDNAPRQLGLNFGESLERMQELAGIPESASSGATGAGNIAGAPGAIGSGMLKRPKTKIKIKKKKREQ